ncbi:hypothetical protein DPMN_042642 [Dreissena polymorpha]|uniref:Uncharacterized protein n=1 Tax=Dreissena polymorpha TaxID=45954 RepID=A0A9D4CZG9_DREPO|nr:hypothetical protein DPMN_042642 [Dreissena polymorpha]
MQEKSAKCSLKINRPVKTGSYSGGCNPNKRLMKRSIWHVRSHGSAENGSPL